MLLLLLMPAGCVGPAWLVIAGTAGFVFLTLGRNRDLRVVRGRWGLRCRCGMSGLIAGSGCSGLIRGMSVSLSFWIRWIGADWCSAVGTGMSVCFRWFELGRGVMTALRVGSACSARILGRRGGWFGRRRPGMIGRRGGWVCSRWILGRLGDRWASRRIGVG